MLVDPHHRNLYQKLVGRLMHLTNTRPGLTYALSIVSLFMHKLGKQYMSAIMCIL